MRDGRPQDEVWLQYIESSDDALGNLQAICTHCDTEVAGFLDSACTFKKIISHNWPNAPAFGFEQKKYKETKEDDPQPEKMK